VGKSSVARAALHIIPEISRLAHANKVNLYQLISTKVLFLEYRPSGTVILDAATPVALFTGDGTIR
jgi:hypothetical protein